MAHVLLLGHTKHEMEISEVLARNFHVLTSFPSIPQAIDSMRFLQPDVVLVPENTSATARADIVQRVQKVSPAAKLVFLYEHYIDSAQFADAIVDAKGDTSYLIEAIDFVCLRQGSIWKSAVAA